MDTLKQFLDKNYKEIRENSISGRWVRFRDIDPLYNDLGSGIQIVNKGFSEEQRPICHLRLGTGPKKILIWSQMHGNESTGTKAVFDLLKFFKNYHLTEIVKGILKNCTIEIIPMLNPDGAEEYTRVNSNNVDLNRDAVAIEAKESRFLRNTLDNFKPDFCFNLHDQRTIFGVSGTKNPATISFLAPSVDETRKLTKGRKETMNVIAVMNSLLQQYIPNHVGRYTDEFYPTATGDNFQKLGYNTILIEAGHFPDDYKREQVRKYNFIALLQGILHISKSDNFSEYDDYFKIPNNEKFFVDVIHKYKYKYKNQTKYFMYKEQIISESLVFSLEQFFTDKINIYGHKELFFA